MNNFNNDNLPLGAYNDTRAPWNEYNEQHSFNVNFTNILSKEYDLSTNQVKEGIDEDNTLVYTIDRDSVNWKEEFDCSGHLTILEILKSFEGILKEKIEESENFDKKKVSYYKHLLEECQGWEEIDYEFEEA